MCVFQDSILSKMVEPDCVIDFCKAGTDLDTLAADGTVVLYTKQNHVHPWLKFKSLWLVQNLELG